MLKYFKEEGEGKPEGDGAIQFTPEQQAVVDKIIGKRLEAERKKQADALKGIEELSAKAKRTEEENTKLQQAMTELREANMTAEERGKEKWKREIGSRDQQIANLSKNVESYRKNFEAVVVDNALRQHVVKAGFNPKAVDHFVAFAKTKAVVEVPEDGNPIVKINSVADVNGVKTPVVLDVEKYVNECAQSDEWAYALERSRKTGTGFQMPINGGGNGSGAIPGDRNERLAAALKKDKIIS